jgi:hypothetical protein
LVTKLLDLAIAEVRKLPAADQDETAEMLLWAIETRTGSLSLDDEPIAAIEEGVAQARRGELASSKFYLLDGPKFEDFSIERDGDSSLNNRR